MSSVVSLPDSPKTLLSTMCKRMMLFHWCYLFFGAVIVLSNCEKPNIVIVLADDLGYGDLGVYGHPTSFTPNLNKMARDGLLFKQFYTASPVCSPSRAALLTGRYQVRSGIYPGVFNAPSIGGLPLNETTIAESLKLMGYNTTIVGKWHLGVGKKGEYLPTRHGFDHYLGIPYSHDMCPCITCFYPNTSCYDKCRTEDTPCPLYKDETIIEQPANFLTLTKNYISFATSFIKTSAASRSPFLLYLAFQHTHHPQFAGKTFANTTIRGDFGDSITEMDWAIGEVVQVLKNLEVDHNTLLFFTSDNGPSLVRRIRGGNAGLLRCGKGTTWEGGQRVPAIAHWPGKILPGVTTELAATVDIFPTVLKLVGAPLPNVKLDGVDMSPILFNTGQSGRDYYVYYTSNVTPKIGMSALRWRQYKAHFNSHGGLCPNDYPDMVCRSNYTFHEYNPPLLYNLHTDPGELYSLDSNCTEYETAMVKIQKVKSKFEAELVWAKSQIDRGDSKIVEPCARPGCHPFPECCITGQDYRYFVEQLQITSQ